ncbi:hypothetical protein QBZ16_000435 [Prototheca wickerhamii]|uniref:Glycosyltransferase n=1 Tax=Prototheca wickerhamii TaxID=3111 RepID=A0AAD9MP88_PROWI|nr:hypothetical protein QBZ16_000435 [Prototheca wickerhamii]
MAVSNINLAQPGGMLDAWMRNVKRAGVTNAFVLALDDETKENVEKFGFPVFRMHQKIPKAQQGNGSNHAVSAMKFRILKEFLQLGYSVFLSDVDILTFKNPFEYLARDSDVEAMSDGWDKLTAYGYDDVMDDQEMGWSRYAHSIRVFCFNSGLFYIRASQASMDLIDKVIERVEGEGGWDQAIFNEVIFFPSHPNYKASGGDPSVTRRVLDMRLFMNSKYLFKYHRHEPDYHKHTPVMLHVNYHSNKFERMLAAEKRYVHGELTALDEFPVGS